MVNSTETVLVGILRIMKKLGAVFALIKPKSNYKPYDLSSIALRVSSRWRAKSTNCGLAREISYQTTNYSLETRHHGKHFSVVQQGPTRFIWRKPEAENRRRWLVPFCDKGYKVWPGRRGWSGPGRNERQECANQTSAPCTRHRSLSIPDDWRKSQVSTHVNGQWITCVQHFVTPAVDTHR